jgi:hypothetical protein
LSLNFPIPLKHLMKFQLPMVGGISVVVALVFWWEGAVGQPPGADPGLKAAYIYNFTRYIRWDAGPEKPDFIIGEMGHSEMDSSLANLARNNFVDNRRIVLRHFARPEDIEYCQILFIPSKCEYPLHTILGKLGRGVLTIGERKGCAREGVALNFVQVNQKLKFEANERVMNKMGLKVSSQLLKLAIIVR